MQTRINRLMPKIVTKKKQTKKQTLFEIKTFTSDGGRYGN